MNDKRKRNKKKLFKQKKIGKIFKVLFDRKEGKYFIGRTEYDSPDVDNEVLVESKNAYVRIGDFANVIVKNVMVIRSITISLDCVSLFALLLSLRFGLLLLHRPFVHYCYD